MKKIRILLPLLIALALTAAVLTMTGCNKANGNAGEIGDSASGESKTVTVKVTDDKGVVTDYVISTTAKTLRGALDQEGLVEGEEDQFGLYVKKVNGLRADYDLDGAYWAFSRGETMLMTGIDSTPIYDGDVFYITYTKS